jgi:ribonuclease HI
MRRSRSSCTSSWSSSSEGAALDRRRRARKPRPCRIRVRAAEGAKIGIATNNVAEYSALIAGLEKALELGVDQVEVVSDSELMVKQMTGEYRVKNEALRELSLEAGRLARRIGLVDYRAVRREQNTLADTLVNEALDAP